MSPKEYRETIEANGTEIAVLTSGTDDDYISLTDIAKHRNPEEPKIVVANWMRNRNTIEFLGLWEQLNNPNFNGIEFDTFKHESGANAFTLSPQKWITATNAVGIVSRSGRYGGGTYAHKDIAFEFASWISAEFRLYIIKEYQRLKLDENSRLSLDWNLRRELAKVNYKIHTDAIKEKLMPADLTLQQQGYVYANEADMLNMALFGQTAKQWKQDNPGMGGNIRDWATHAQLLILGNLEGMNAEFIKQTLSQPERMRRLREIALSQMQSISNSAALRNLEENDKKKRLK